MKKPKIIERNERNRGPHTQYQMKNTKEMNEMKEIGVPVPSIKWINPKEMKEMKEIGVAAHSIKWKK